MARSCRWAAFPEASIDAGKSGNTLNTDLIIFNRKNSGRFDLVETGVLRMAAWIQASGPQLIICKASFQ